MIIIIIVLQRRYIYPYRSIGTPRRHQLRRLLPVCITVLWVLGSYTDRQLLQYCTYTADRAVIQTGKSRLFWTTLFEGTLTYTACFLWTHFVVSFSIRKPTTFLYSRKGTEKVVNIENYQCNIFTLLWFYFAYPYTYIPPSPFSPFTYIIGTGWRINNNQHATVCTN